MTNSYVKMAGSTGLCYRTVQEATGLRL